MVENEEIVECQCGHPINSSELESVSSFTCPNCGVEFDVSADDDEIDEDEDFSEYEKDEKGDEHEGYEEGDEDEVDLVVSTEEDEVEEFDREDDEDRGHHKKIDEHDYSHDVTHTEDEELGEDPHEVDKEILELDEEKPLIKKKKRHIVKHRLQNQDYMIYFLEHDEGVTIDMLMKEFSLDLQAAHYAQRRTFKDALKLGYECDKKQKNNSNKKMFFIRRIL